MFGFVGPGAVECPRLVAEAFGHPFPPAGEVWDLGL